MMILSEEQPKTLNKNALVIIVVSLQGQLRSIQAQLDTAINQLSDTILQTEFLTEQVVIDNEPDDLPY